MHFPFPHSWPHTPHPRERRLVESSRRVHRSAAAQGSLSRVHRDVPSKSAACGAGLVTDAICVPALAPQSAPSSAGGPPWHGRRWGATGRGGRLPRGQGRGEVLSPPPSPPHTPLPPPSQAADEKVFGTDAHPPQRMRSIPMPMESARGGKRQRSDGSDAPSASAASDVVAHARRSDPKCGMRHAPPLTCTAAPGTAHQGRCAVRRRCRCDGAGGKGSRGHGGRGSHPPPPVPWKRHMEALADQDGVFREGPWGAASTLPWPPVNPRKDRGRARRLESRSRRASR